MKKMTLNLYHFINNYIMVLYYKFFVAIKKLSKNTDNQPFVLKYTLRLILNCKSRKFSLITFTKLFNSLITTQNAISIILNKLNSSRRLHQLKPDVQTLVKDFLLLLKILILTQPR
jgi:hypothetical protein